MSSVYELVKHSNKEYAGNISNLGMYTKYCFEKEQYLCIYNFLNYIMEKKRKEKKNKFFLMKL